MDALLARRDVEVIVVAPSGTWPDAARNAAHVVGFVTVGSETGGSSASDRGAAGRVAAGEALDGRDSGEKIDAIGDDWLKGWQEADRTAQRVVGDVLEAGPLTGPLVAREVWAAVRPGEALVVGSSNAIRDLDLTASPFGAAQPLTEESGRGVAADELGPAVYSNRGLAGIDGTVSTAAGVALGSGETTRVLLGDLAFLHDIGGLLIGPHEEEPRLQIVVLNDDGGGIFTLLEHGAPAYADVFERVFGTPHGADLAALCRGYGVRHSRIDDFDELRSALSAPVSGRSVIEVTLDRSSHRDLHGQIRASVDDAIGE